jgi:acetylornithine deacetylase/succinyl-diaminopimelate desuccinylase-like protein
VHESGRPLVVLGVRGMLSVELRAHGANRDVHSGNRGGVVPYPAWELVHLLASLRRADGRVAIDGFYDASGRRAPPSGTPSRGFRWTRTATCASTGSTACRRPTTGGTTND